MVTVFLVCFIHSPGCKNGGEVVDQAAADIETHTSLFEGSSLSLCGALHTWPYSYTVINTARPKIRARSVSILS
jgi:hypothetical protein